MASARLAPSFLPATAVLELTYRCNHQCLFCSCPWEKADGSFPRLQELTTKEWKTVITRLAELGVSNLAFSGGEALLREDCLELMRFARGCTVEHIETVDGELTSQPGPPKVYLLSNGAAVDRGVLAFCREHEVQLSLSLPGLDAFERLTGGGSADQVLRCFSEARALGLDTVANITVTRLNLPELRETMSAALLAGALQILLNRFLPGGRGLLHAEELSLNVEELQAMLNIAEDVLEDAGAWGSLGAEIPKCVVPARDFKRLTIGTRCSAAIQFFVVDPSGYTRVCNHSTVRLEPFERIECLKTHEYWRRFAFKKYLPETCFACSLMDDCDGGCREAAHIVGGCLDALDPLLIQLGQTAFSKG
jgi:radical SAM protein with 4Fe4S-binding SPASM domain